MTAPNIEPGRPGTAPAGGGYAPGTPAGGADGAAGARVSFPPRAESRVMTAVCGSVMHDIVAAKSVETAEYYYSSSPCSIA